MLVDFDVSEPPMVSNDQITNDTVDAPIAEIPPAVQIPPEPDPPVSDVITTRKGRVIRKPSRYREIEKKIK